MLDLHAHILPGLDDGAISLAESVLMGKKLADLGFTGVVGTPHLRLEGKQDPGLKGEAIRRKARALNQALEEKKIALEVVAGAELMYRPGLVEVLEKRGFYPTLGESQYLLLELPFFQPLPPRFQQDLFLLQTRGYRPVLAHPERNLCFLQSPQLLYGLAQQGLLFQVTLASLTGHLGRESRRLALELVQGGLATFAGTDAHDHKDERLDQVPRALEVLGELGGEELTARLIGGNARRALAGEHLEQVEVSPEEEPVPGRRAAAPAFFRKILQRKKRDQQPGV